MTHFRSERARRVRAIVRFRSGNGVPIAPLSWSEEWVFNLDKSCCGWLRGIYRLNAYGAVKLARNYFGSSALLAGSNSIIVWAASHMRSKWASNFAAAPASRMMTRSLSR